MKTRRVRAGSLYRYEPVLLDRFNPPYNIRTGDIVRVVNLPGCPKANTMGHAHVEHRDGRFAGLVCTNSLRPIGGKTNMKITLERVMDAVSADDNLGFCLACGAEAYGVEPDARKYECESCGERKVYGAEELLIRMAI